MQSRPVEFHWRVLNVLRQKDQIETRTDDADETVDERPALLRAMSAAKLKTPAVVAMRSAMVVPADAPVASEEEAAGSHSATTTRWEDLSPAWAVPLEA